MGHELVDAAETLIFQAGELSGAQFRSAVAHWERLADRDGPEPDPAVTHARRSASWLQQLDGTWQLRARLDAAQGAVVAEHLEALLHGAFTEELASVDDNGQLDRTGPQRRADVVADAVIRGARSHRGNGPDIVVDVLIDHDTFTEHLGRALGLEPDRGDRPRQERVCRTASGVEVHPDDAVAAAIEGRVRRVVFDSAGVVIDLGRTQRLFTGSARRALGLADHGCVWAGCEAPTTWCQGDHVVPWHRDGPTDQANGGLLCPRHNRMKNYGWSTRRARDGTWQTLRPDGSTVTPAIPPFQPAHVGPAAA
ncbi:MAG: HNH endonuclease [Actinomycetota bacterium]